MVYVDVALAFLEGVELNENPSELSMFFVETFNFSISSIFFIKLIRCHHCKLRLDYATLRRFTNIFGYEISFGRKHWCNNLEYIKCDQNSCESPPLYMIADRYSTDQLLISNLLHTILKHQKLRIFRQ